MHRGRGGLHVHGPRSGEPPSAACLPSGSYVA